MTASPLSAFKTFYASTLRPRSGGQHLTWGKISRQSAPVTAFSMPSPSGIVISGHCPRSLRQSLTAKYGMGSRKYMVVNRWKRARKGPLES